MADYRADCEYCQKSKRLFGYGVCISCDNNECNPIFDTQGTTTTNVPCSAYLEIKNEGYNKSKL